nr:PREDICTED: 60S ribosomal protein L28-like [Rhinolophus sinicus]
MSTYPPWVVVGNCSSFLIKRNEQMYNELIHRFTTRLWAWSQQPRAKVSMMVTKQRSGHKSRHLLHGAPHQQAHSGHSQQQGQVLAPRPAHGCHLQNGHHACSQKPVMVKRKPTRPTKSS